MESIGASVQDGKIPEGLSAVAIEAKRVREFGFGAGEMDRARKWMAAFYERAYTERDKTESGSFAQEYLNHFLEGEPSPGIDYEYALVQQLLPGINADGGIDGREYAAGGRQPRGARGVPAKGRDCGADRGADARVAAVGRVGGRHRVERHDLDT